MFTGYFLGFIILIQILDYGGIRSFLSYVLPHTDVREIIQVAGVAFPPEPVNDVSAFSFGQRGCAKIYQFPFE
jgi:hypothetical protein